MIEAYLGVLELGYFEGKVAFEGLADEHVWKRPAEELLSVGELAGHIASWEAVKLAGEGREPEPDVARRRVSSPLIDHRFDDLAKCRVRSPLIDHRFAYYPTTLANPPSEQQLQEGKQHCRGAITACYPSGALASQSRPQLRHLTLQGLAPGALFPGPLLGRQPCLLLLFIGAQRLPR
jgi:hypothetical protein